jgi:dihydroxyacetone kinase
MDKDQLIERLYTKVRIQEAQLARKDEQIEVLTRRMDKLVEMICEEVGEGRKGVALEVLCKFVEKAERRQRNGQWRGRPSGNESRL